MKIVSTLLLVLLLPLRVPAETLDDANRAFAAGRFEESTVSFRNILAQQGYSAPVLFDLGNSYLSQGDFSQAILAYKRAQLLAPHDPDIEANLRLAQTKAGVPVRDARWDEKVGLVLSPNGWAWTASAAWALLCGSTLAGAAMPQSRRLFFVTGMAGALALCAAATGIVLSMDHLRQAVVIEKEAKALISPFPAAQTVFTPPSGETLNVQKAYSDYLLVSDSNGHTGWIAKKEISRIVDQ